MKKTLTSRLYRVLSRSLALCLLLVSYNLLAAAQRVISLSPSTTELAYAAGMGEQMVAASSYSDYPDAAQQLERVADHRGINVERILLLKPDLVLAWKGGNPTRPLQQLEQLGIPVFYADPRRLDDLASELDQLAAYSAHPDEARANAQALRQQFSTLQRTYQRQTPIPVFIQYGTQAMFTPGVDTLQSQIVSLCGGKNIFADSGLSWPKISREQVLLRKPHAIIVPGNAETVAEVRRYWQGMLDVPVIAVEESLLSRSGPRM
ncbi:MAG: vitamin B12 ABC transporter substrate-binding protein BtuF, partial [Plesiomonas shigelloides]